MKVRDIQRAIVGLDPDEEVTFGLKRKPTKKPAAKAKATKTAKPKSSK